MLAIQTSTDLSKPPLNVIQEPVQNPKQEKLVVGLRSKIERTPIKVNKVGPNIAFLHSVQACLLGFGEATIQVG